MKKDAIIDHLNKDSQLILLNGTWGSGKTYRWKNHIQPELKKDSIYVSLFGLRNVDELKKEIFNKWVERCFEDIILHNNLFIKIYAVTSSIPPSRFLGKFIKSISMHFLSAYAGINHDNLSIRRMFDPKNTVFCFDDLERVSTEAKIGEFLGFFKTLSEDDGFSILLIADYEKCTLSQELSRLYKEKLFDAEGMHEHKDALAEVIETEVDKENKALREFLSEFANLLANFKTTAEKIDDFDSTFKTFPKEEVEEKEDEKKILALKANIRFFKKFIKNMRLIYEKTGGFAILSQEDTHKDLMKFVLRVTKDMDQNELKKDYTDAIWKGVCKDAEINLFFQSDRCFPEVLDFLALRQYDETAFKRELMPISSLTEFEKACLSLNKPLDYRTPYIKEKLESINNIIDKSNGADLFSEASENMFRTIRYYCWWSYYAEQDPRMDIIVENIKSCINSMPDEIQDDELSNWCRVYRGEPVDIVNNMHTIKEEAKKFFHDKRLDDMRKDKYFFESSGYFYNDPSKIIVWNDRFGEFSKLKDSDYKRWCEIISAFEYCIEHNRYTKLDRSLLHSLLEKLQKDIEELENDSKSGRSEKHEWTFKETIKKKLKLFSQTKDA